LRNLLCATRAVECSTDDDNISVQLEKLRLEKEWEKASLESFLL